MNYIHSIPLFLLAAQCAYFIKKSDTWTTTSGLLLHHALCIALCGATVVGLRTVLWPASPLYAVVAYGFGAFVLATVSGRFAFDNSDKTKHKAIIFAVANGLLALFVSRGLR